MAPITEIHGVPVYVSDVKEWQRAKKKKRVSPRSFFRFMAEKHGPTRWHFHFAARYPKNADAISRLAEAQRKSFADNEFAEARALTMVCSGDRRECGQELPEHNFVVLQRGEPRAVAFVGETSRPLVVEESFEQQQSKGNSLLGKAMDVLKACMRHLVFSASTR